MFLRVLVNILYYLIGNVFLPPTSAFTLLSLLLDLSIAIIKSFPILIWHSLISMYPL